MTVLVFRDDPEAMEVAATVVSAGPDGVVLDRTVFYPNGGGQPGDVGQLTWSGGSCAIIDTVKAPDGHGVVHKPAAGAPLPPEGAEVTGTLDGERRRRHMRMHTALHLLCASVEGDVTGGQIGAEKSRLDFNIPAGSVDKEALEVRLNALIQEDHPVSTLYIPADDLESRPDLVRTMSVRPPAGADGTIRLVRIGPEETPVDLQACGGTHVPSTAAIGRVVVGKIENKGKQNRRIHITLAE